MVAGCVVADAAARCVVGAAVRQMVARTSARCVASGPAEVAGGCAAPGGCAGQGGFAYRVPGLCVGVRSCLVGALCEGAVLVVEVAVAVQVGGAFVEGGSDGAFGECDGSVGELDGPVGEGGRA